MNKNTARRDDGGAKPICEMLSNEFAENYIEKLFYFCLKKTGSADEAEELSADITLQVMSALAKGTVPQSFSAWVWQIARNRCARWAKARSLQRAAFAPDDVSGYELPDERDDSNVESALVQDEQIKLLRRELAFISREYRDIVVAHYIENRRLSQIARALSLPEGTVKTRLARARNILKEGMNMAREFGQRSYKPEELNFAASGNQPSGLPWSAVQRLIPVNILCEANNNPCTVEELSVELGVAMPYMEEEVRILEEGELLQKTEDGKYVTAFFIAPRECRTEFNVLCGGFIDKNHKAIWDLAGIVADKAQGYGALDGCITREDAQMYFAFAIEDAVRIAYKEKYVYFKRRDGGNWGFIGYESNAVLRPTLGTWSHNSGENIWSYQHDGDGHNWKSLQHTVAPAISELAAKEWKIDGVSDVSRSVLTGLTHTPATVKDMGNGIWKPDMIVLKGTSAETVLNAVGGNAEFKRIISESRELYGRQMQIIEKYMYPLLRKDSKYYTFMLSFESRPMLYTALVNNGLYTGDSKAFYAVKIG